ncbi:MAG: hypothetical protein L0I94_08405 [Yaniella sp.]|nr:hypothetical protein [Yaniella sp.]
MEHAAKRLCPSCGDELSEAALSQQKYCSLTCRERMKKRRRRLKEGSSEPAELQRLQAVDRHVEKLQSDYRKLLRRFEARDRKIRRLEHALRRADTQLEAVAHDQALRTRAVRDELAASRREVATVKRNWSIEADADRAGAMVTDLRTRLAVANEKYSELAMKYRELTDAAKYAAAERKHLQGIVRQWDSMCKRLNTATGGRPRKEADKKVLATWKQFRKLVHS